MVTAVVFNGDICSMYDSREVLNTAYSNAPISAPIIVYTYLYVYYVRMLLLAKTFTNRLLARVA